MAKFFSQRSTYFFTILKSWLKSVGDNPLRSIKNRLSAVFLLPYQLVQPIPPNKMPDISIKMFILV